jgi:heme/copper-type cytochrome/quinol oxidase subunit 1
MAPGSTAPAPADPGLAAILGSGDHKVVGRLWIVAALAHALLAGVIAILVALEKVDLSGTGVLGASSLPNYVAYRSVAAAFLFLLPLTVGLATLVVPLQVGASAIAFPRAAAAAVWTYLLGGGLLVASFLIDGGPAGADRDAVLLFVVAFAMVLLALVVAWICVATAVIALRVPGLSLVRAPLFAWSALVAATVWVLTLSSLAAVTVLAYLDIRYGGLAGFFGGGQATLYARIGWVFSTPAVFAFVIPALGVVGSIVPVACQTRHQQHRVGQGLIGAFGALSAGAWVMPGFGTDPAPWLYEVPWVAVSIAVILPLLGLVGLWALTAKQGSPKLTSPLLFAAASTLLVLVGAAAGAVQAIKPIKTIVDGPGTSLYGTSWSTGVASFFVLGAVTALVGGLVYWAPKFLGRSLAEAGARLVALLLLAGTVLWALPDLVAGLLGQPGSPGEAPLDNVSTIETLNLVSIVGAAVVAAALVILVGLLLAATRTSVLPGDDPWGGHTLEWATSSPPPLGNFASLPEVTSEAPLYDARHRAQEASA